MLFLFVYVIDPTFIYRRVFNYIVYQSFIELF